MTTERRMMLTIAVSPDGTKCAAECPHCNDVQVKYRGQDGMRSALACDLFGILRMDLRDPACIAAESAAREPEVDALRRGYDIGVAHTGWGEMGAGDRAMEAEIERIRRGES